MKKTITLIAVFAISMTTGCGKSAEEKAAEQQAQAQAQDARLLGGLKREEPPKPRPYNPKNF